MTSTVRKHAVGVLLALSLLLNGAMIGYLANSGGLRRFFVKLDLAEPPKTRKQFQSEMEARFRKLPNTPAEVDFVGDSLVGDCPWAEYFGEIHNRGIGGETSAGVLGRIDEVTESRPRKVFLLLGTNDLAEGVPAAQLIRNYRSLLEKIREDSPGTAVHVIGLLPINPTLPVKPTQSNAQIVEVNESLAKLVAEFPGVTFLDLSPLLADKDGNLRVELSRDGIHLNPDGYQVVTNRLAGLVAEGETRKAPEPTAKP